MNGSQFDVAAAFSGGGFMTSQATQNTDPAPNYSSKNQNTQTLIPLTVKQISKALQSSDDKVNFLIDGVDVNNVKMVGMLCNKIERVTDVNFSLDDGTGRIDCNRWVNDPVDAKEMEALSEGTYVRIHGQLKGFQGQKKLVVFGIKPVTDFDEITHHLVECIYVHSYNTKLLKQQPSTSTQSHVPNTSNQFHIPNSGVTTQFYQTAPPNQFTAQHAADDLGGIHQRVINYMNQPASVAREAGVHIEEIARQLGMPLDKIREVIHVLVDDAMVYSTIDDNHFKSTING